MTADKFNDPQWLADNTYRERRSGKTTLNKAGRVDLAHDELLENVTTTIVQIPHPDNGHIAIVQTSVQTKRGTFGAIGFANPENCTTRLKNGQVETKDPLPMAEARALSRALDLALNYGRGKGDTISAADPDDAFPDDPDDDQPHTTPAPPITSIAPEARPAPKPTPRPSASGPRPMTAGQRKTLTNLYHELGEEPDIPESATYDGARDLITALDDSVRRLRQQRRTAP